MEPARKRRTSPVWEHFELVAHNKVKCLLCHKELTYSNNTSSMLRHYRAMHEDAQPAANRPDTSQNYRKKMVDEALVNMVIKDSQPFSVVDDVGFRELVHVLDPSYVLPTRKALKSMVDSKYEEAKEKAKEKLDNVVAVSLTSDMWTSINMEAYLAVTCHFIDANDQLGTILLGVQHFPNTHTAENLAISHTMVMEEWGIKDKVRKSFDDVPDLNQLRTKCRKLVTYFRTSTTGKERLAQVQVQMGRPTLKMIIEVDTRWNSTYSMLERMYDLREPVGAALASLRTDVSPPSSLEYDTIKDALEILAPFHQATVELSAEKIVSASKVIPLLKMLNHTILTKSEGLTSNMARQLADNLVRRVREHALQMESISVMTMPTLLDPRFKKLGFLSPGKLQDAITRLKSECVNVIRNSDTPPPAQLPASQAGQSTTCGDLWHLLDTTVDNSRRSSSVTADATIEVDRYLSETNLAKDRGSIGILDQTEAPISQFI
ncbi:E3 SUMO-protein ligase ZBED1-like [Paramisgurnus dabryanus]|uniref:E3 SUMO-protein ligase ZBED1-like n=1 Tax=Paramisgurnus dabryanus TaxID=90735 RepID=UPI003CCFDEC0